jgi:hypothetical protein
MSTLCERRSRRRSRARGVAGLNIDVCVWLSGEGLKLSDLPRKRGRGAGRGEGQAGSGGGGYCPIRATALGYHSRPWTVDRGRGDRHGT